MDARKEVTLTCSALTGSTQKPPNRPSEFATLPSLPCERQDILRAKLRRTFPERQPTTKLAALVNCLITHDLRRNLVVFRILVVGWFRGGIAGKRVAGRKCLGQRLVEGALPGVVLIGDVLI
jgi:hypothetical protein